MNPELEFTLPGIFIPLCSDIFANPKITIDQGFNDMRNYNWGMARWRRVSDQRCRPPKLVTGEFETWILESGDGQP